MLTLELRKLEDAGIVARSEFEGYPLRVEFDLTPAGLKLVPLLDALGSWSDVTEAGRGQTGTLPVQLTE
jgi:DNA-binding HxlR family transcriptional regulator